MLYGSRFGMMLVGVGALLALFSGCAKPPPAVSPAKDPEVIVDTPVVRKITDYEEFIGRTEALKKVDIKARATGYLKGIYFKDGEIVSEGAPLFEVDPILYDAEVHRAKALLEQADALLRRMETDKKRAERLRPQGTISQEEADRVFGDYDVAKAAVAVARAALELTEKNLAFTHVSAPWRGKLGMHLIDPGNLVKADETMLATMVSLGKLYATFDIDERTKLRLVDLAKQGAIPSSNHGVIVDVGFANEDGYSTTGTVNFEDNVANPNTGTIRARAVVEDPNDKLVPGLFARVRFPVGAEHTAVLVPEEALASDQGQKYLYVVDAQNKVEYRRVKVGASQDGYRVIIDGVKPDERIIVSGLQRVRPGLKVTVKEAVKKK